MRAVLLLLALGSCLMAADRIEPRFEGDDLPVRKLKAAARRELAAFDREHRATDLHDAAYAMEMSLRGIGYAHATVKFDMVPDEASVREVVFRIDRGPLCRLQGVTFPGLPAKKAKRLAKYFTAKRSLFAFGKPTFSERAIESGLKQVERGFLLDGYYEVVIGPVVYHWNADRSRVSLEVPVVRGTKFTVSEVHVAIEGDEGNIDNEAIRRLAALEGKPYHVRLPAEAASALRAKLMHRGHHDATVQSSAVIDRESGHVTIEFRVRPGPIYHWRKLTITSVQEHPRTNQSFIAGRLRPQPGTVIDQDKLDHGVSELYRSGAFRTVRTEFANVTGEGADRDADIIVHTDELPARELELGAGWGSYELLRGSARYHEYNLFGTGRSGDIGAYASMRSYGADANFIDRYTLGDHNTLTATIARDFREEPSFDLTSNSAKVSVRHDINAAHSITVGHEFRADRADDVKGAIPEAERAGFVTLSELFTRWARDTTDNPVNPSIGSHTQGAVLWSNDIFGDLSFLGYDARWRRYNEIRTGLVSALELRYQTRQVLNGADTLPIQERLFLGGDSDVRSFGRDELGPTDADGDPIGGLTSALASVELRFDIYRPLYGAVFYDVGSVGEDTWELDFPPGHAIGAGLRYYLPIGPIRVDAAYNPGERFAADHPWAIHVAVGFSF